MASELLSKRLICAGMIRHDEDEYLPGTLFIVPADHLARDPRTRELVRVPYTVAEQEALVAGFIKSGFLVPEGEAKPQEVISSQEQEIARLNAELEEMKRKHGVPERLGDGGGLQPESSPQTPEDAAAADEPLAAPRRPGNRPGGRNR